MGSLFALVAASWLARAATLRPLADSPLHRFVQGNIGDAELVGRLLREEAVDGVMHLAAESHVDRSIDGPMVFVETNVVGTVRLLAAVTDYWRGLEGAARDRFRCSTQRRK